MAAACLRSTFLLSKTLRVSDVVLRVSHFQSASCRPLCVLNQLVPVRHGSFFNRKSADDMWDSVTSVSNQGRKRGRASRGKLLRRVNLYVGHKLGHGKTGLVFPGLSSNITGKEKITDLGVRKQQTKEKDTGDNVKIQQKRSGIKLDPLDRGFTGRKLAGRKIDPPDPVGGYDFSDFDAYILESKLVAKVTAGHGKVASCYVIVAVGNRKGLIGLAIGKASTTAAAVLNAKNKAAQRLVFIDVYKDHTPLHNFTEKFHRTSVIVKQAPEGHGLRCHPVLQILCKLIGIKDIYVKTEGKVRNYLNLSRAFIGGLQKTRTHQELADELGHHIVEISPEKDFYPIVVASPSKEGNKSDFKKEDGFTFESYCFGNKVALNKPSKKPFYWKTIAYKKKLAKEYTRRNQKKSRIDRMVLGFQQEFKEHQHK